MPPLLMKLRTSCGHTKVLSLFCFYFFSPLSPSPLHWVFPHTQSINNAMTNEQHEYFQGFFYFSILTLLPSSLHVCYSLSSYAYTLSFQHSKQSSSIDLWQPSRWCHTIPKWLSFPCSPSFPSLPLSPLLFLFSFQLNLAALLTVFTAKATINPLTEKLKTALKSGSFSDITFRFKEHPQAFNLHKFILSAKCSYFTKMFQGKVSMRAEIPSTPFLFNINSSPSAYPFLIFIFRRKME